MGYRIHQRTTSKINYAEGNFSYEQELLAIVIEKYSDVNLSDDSGYPKEQWEIPIEDLKQVIEGLKKDFKPDEKVFTDWTQQELIDTFERWININKKNKDNLDFPDIITLDWF